MKRYTIEVRNEAPAPYNRWRSVVTWPDGVTLASPTYATEAEAFDVAVTFLRDHLQPVKVAV